jgi:hypothetical protein
MRIIPDKMKTDKNENFNDHKIFPALEYYIEFYGLFSFGVMSFIPPGVHSFLNIDTYVYSSMQMSLDSIKNLLKLSRINDAYALVRKFYDSVIINIYYTLYIKNNIEQYNFIVDKINNWFLGKEKLPSFKSMKGYIENSPYLKYLNCIINFDNRYNIIRENCNNHVHYNSFDTMIKNDSRFLDDHKNRILDQLSSDILNLIIYHFAYIFLLNEQYMSSSDYVDALECGLKPEEGSQYYVAPYIQEFFDKIIKANRKDIAELIIENTSMKINP